MSWNKQRVNGHNTIHFDRIQDVAAFIRRYRMRSSFMQSGNDEWNGMTAEQSLAHCDTGWIPGVEQAEQQSASILDQVIGETELPTMNLDVAGAVPDVGEFLAGAPENMWQYDVQEDAGKIPNKIFVSICPVCHVTVETCIRRGVAIIALALTIERMGFPLPEIIAYAGSPGDNCYTFTVHEGNKLVDWSELAYSIGHPVVLRRLIHAVNDGGFPIPTEDQDRRMLHSVGWLDRPNQEDVIVIPGIQSGNAAAFKTDKSALNWVVAMTRGFTTTKEDLYA